jgi:hypothetical protein
MDGEVTRTCTARRGSGAKNKPERFAVRDCSLLYPLSYRRERRVGVEPTTCAVKGK